MNLLFTDIGGKFKFQVQDRDLEYLFLEIWRFEKHIAFSEKKPPLAQIFLPKLSPLDDIEIFIKFFNFLGTQQLVEAIEKEKSESKKRIKTLESGVAEEMSNNKKELIGKIETVEADIKKKVEMEANETRFVHFLAFTKGQLSSELNL